MPLAVLFNVSISVPWSATLDPIVIVLWECKFHSHIIIQIEIGDFL